MSAAYAIMSIISMVVAPTAAFMICVIIHDWQNSKTDAPSADGSDFLVVDGGL